MNQTMFGSNIQPSGHAAPLQWPGGQPPAPGYSPPPPPGQQWPVMPPGAGPRPPVPGRPRGRGVTIILALALLLLGATGSFVVARFGLGAPNPLTPDGGARAGGTMHYRGMKIAVDPPKVEKTSTGTFRVTAHATVVNEAKWTDDAKHTATLVNTPPQLVIDGKRVGATVTMKDLPAGATGDASFVFDNYQTEPDLRRATIELGDATSKIARIGDPANAASLAPVPVQLAGQLTTGPDTTTVTVTSAELRADVGDTEVPEGKLALRIRYRFTTGTQYTNGAAARWAYDYLELRTPDGTTYQPEEGTTAKSADGEGTIVYFVRDTATGSFTLVDTYVGCCGTAQGSLEFTMPAFGPTGTAAATANR